MSAKRPDNENFPSRLSADEVSNSFAIRIVVAYTILEGKTNVPQQHPCNGWIGRSAHDCNWE